ncbi:similar to Torulaspora delbrueckii TDEL_0E03490 hypothetical protein [Maudiozyma barnettii]|uniref:Transcription activator GCR1-like domain-containing protein n=1 Tax=Maudiozyma barnettii TaxID=61262 RepID=A0A8H2VBW4_9SACH|nr:uncharacterized protein KABA2_01S12474 [Kazachstania barnettii]CAB4252387.1 similar to Torulaspora delbrueckii TDEL_0E03490 hypothetical protein [Kazachstania barnettii]CAD1779122.1 similar to Torulaspora delbrueckii TDEL_0E03490 hypothetical protein [Kazachstania barnettii]
MTIEEIIDSFKIIVNQIAEEWDTIMKLPTFLDCDIIERLEEKLDVVQRQNYSIIIDLNNIKRELQLDKREENIIFCSQDNNDKNETTKIISSSGLFLESSPISPNSIAAVSQYLQIDEDEVENVMSQVPSSHDIPQPECFEGKHEENIYHIRSEPPCEEGILQDTIPISENNKIDQACGSISVKRFDLNMIEAPKTIKQLYDDFDKNLRFQIKDFENQFGKGQLSKLNKIRTYQRRRALINEIEKFSTMFSIDIRIAIEIFEKYRTVRGRTVPFLYNNLTSVVMEIKTEYESSYY